MKHLLFFILSFGIAFCQVNPGPVIVNSLGTLANPPGSIFWPANPIPSGIPFAANGGVTSSTPLFVYAGFIGSADLLQLSNSATGHFFHLMKTSYSPGTDRCVRDDSILCSGTNPYRIPQRINNQIWVSHTTGNFGLCGFFQIASSPDYEHFTRSEVVSPTGLTVTLTANITTISGNASITLASTSGLTNNRFYTVQGNASIPTGAGFKFNSGTGLTQTLDYQSDFQTGLGLTVTATASGTVSSNIVFINNVWGPTWADDGNGNYYIFVSISQNPGVNVSGPGIGYMQITNVAAWKSGAAPTFGNFTSLANIGNVGYNGSYGPILVGSTYYFYYDDVANNRYATASSFLGPYTDQGVVSSNFGSGTHNSESSQIIQTSATSWRFYFVDKNQPQPTLYWSELTGSATPVGTTWTTPQIVGFPYVSAGFLGAGCPVAVNNYDDIHQVLSAEGAPYLSSIVTGSGPIEMATDQSRINFYTSNTATQGNNGILAARLSQFDNVMYQNTSGYPALNLSTANGWGVAYTNGSAPSTQQKWVSVVDSTNGNWNLYTSATNASADPSGTTLGTDEFFVDRSGNGTFLGTSAATSFIGSGSSLTTLNASNLSSGTVPAARMPALTGDVTSTSGSVATTVGKINGVSLAGLATGILKNTTGTGVPSIAVAADFPMLNQNTTGTAATAILAGALAGGSLGSVPYSTSSTSMNFVSPNTSTTQKFLTQTGTGSVGAAPAWFDLFGSANTFTATQTSNSVDFAEGFHLNGTGTNYSKVLVLGNTTGGTDSKYWAFAVQGSALNGGEFTLGPMSDSGTLGANTIAISRSGNAATTFDLIASQYVDMQNANGFGVVVRNGNSGVGAFVGIYGVTSPAFPLDVAGDIETSTNFRCSSVTASTMAAWDASSPRKLVSASENVNYSGPVTMTANTTGTITFNTAGHSETISDSSSTLLATATITMPSSSTQGQLLTYVGNEIITTLTITGGTQDVGPTLPTTLAANKTLQFQEVGTGGHYVRIQ